jgi:xanthine dehydrogenase accessory factor
MASAVAHRLFKCGFRVLMTEMGRPTAVRRRVSFCSSIYEGEIIVEGVRGVSHSLSDLAFLQDFDWSHIPVFVDPDCSLAKIWGPEVIVDARMKKKKTDTHKGDAELVIGLGPELEAGSDVHLVVETNRGHRLGRIIDRGKADHYTGEPGKIGGYTYERVLRAPADGIFESNLKIGNKVKADDLIGFVSGSEVRAKIPGVIRGIIMSGISVSAGQKLGDIDPRSDESFCSLISDKARTISGSVLEIVVSHVYKKNY